MENSQGILINRDFLVTLQNNKIEFLSNLKSLMWRNRQCFWFTVLKNLWIKKVMLRLQKCPNTEFFLIRIFSYSVRIWGNTDQNKLCIFEHFSRTPYLDTFHAVYGERNCVLKCEKNLDAFKVIQNNVLNTVREGWTVKYLNWTKKILLWGKKVEAYEERHK